MPKITDSVWIEVVRSRKALSFDHADGRDGIPISNVLRTHDYHDCWNTPDTDKVYSYVRPRERLLEALGHL